MIGDKMIAARVIDLMDTLEASLAAVKDKTTAMKKKIPTGEEDKTPAREGERKAHAR